MFQETRKKKKKLSNTLFLKNRKREMKILSNDSFNVDMGQIGKVSDWRKTSL